MKHNKVTKEIISEINKIPTLSGKKEFILNYIENVEYNSTNIKSEKIYKLAKLRLLISQCISEQKLHFTIWNMLLSGEKNSIISR